MKLLTRNLPQLTPALREKIAQEDQRSERLIAVIQGCALVFYGLCFLLAPRATDNTSEIQPVLIVIGIALPVSALRLFLAFKDWLRSWGVYCFICFDILFLTLLIGSFHIQYDQPLSFSLKSPSFVHFFVFIALRCFQLQAKYLLFTGACTLIAWGSLTLLASQQPGIVITQSFTQYSYADHILIGAEIEKLIGVALVVIILWAAAQRASQRFAREVAQIQQANVALEAARTERIKAEQTKLALEQQKVKFLTMASHELRTPMNGLLGSLELIPNPEEHTSTACRSAEKLLAIINKMICLSSADDLVVRPRYHKIRALRQQIQNLGQFGRHPEQRLDIDTTLPEHATVFLDWSLTEPILNELIENAYKFDTFGRIRLNISLEKKTLRFGVINIGKTISPTDQQRIFNCFTQAEEDLSRPHQGLGLGLSTAATLAEKIGASLTLTQSDTSGTIFTLALPQKRAEKLTVSHDEDGPLTSLNEPIERVLVVEDNPVNQQVILKMLACFGIEPTLTTDGLAALEAYKAGDFQLIFMDIQMPVMDGCEATEKIRQFEQKKNKPPCQIVAVTAHAHGDYFNQIKPYGFDALLVKPVRLNMLEKYLNRPRIAS